eukprot:Em0018g962a
MLELALNRTFHLGVSCFERSSAPVKAWSILLLFDALATPHDNPKVEQKREPAQTVITSWYNFVATACYSS